MKKHVLYAACAVLLLGACKKDVENGSSVPQAKNGPVTSENYDEDLYDLHIQTGTFGLMNLVQDQEFRNLVVGECNKQFDGDDNVLFKTLGEIFEENNVDLAAEMTTSLNAYGKGSLVQYVDGVINGFDYYDTKIYLQVYVPFLENANMENVTVVASNFNDDEVLDAYYAQSASVLATVPVDEEYASESPVFVVSGNESVGADGKLPMVVKDSYNKLAKISKVYIRELGKWQG